MQTPPEVVDEARQRHYQDQPFSTAALMGGAAGLAAPTALGLLLDHKAVLRNPMPYLHAGAVMSPLGAVTGVGAEATGRLLTRGLGPSFDRRHWHRDQDPHRWNSALRTAPLVAALLAGRALPSLLQRMPELQGKQASSWGEWLRGKAEGAAHTALSPLKRYISNLPNLYGYDAQHVDNAIKFLPRAYDMAVKDKPMDTLLNPTDVFRRELFRRGLGVHESGAADAFKPTPGGTLQLADRLFTNDKLNPEAARSVLGEISNSPVYENYNPVMRSKRLGIAGNNPAVVQAPTSSPTLGNHTIKYKGNGIFNVSDKWDMALNPGDEQKPSGQGMVGLARKTLDRMMTPAVFNQDFQQLRDGSLVRIDQTPVTPHPSVPAVAAVKGSSVRDHKTRVQEAEAQVAVPTQGQIDGGGNYRKGHLRLHGLDITLETASGQERKGIAADGTPWSVTLTDPYGYIKETDSAEPGDQMDVFIGPDPASETVYVVDQNKPGTQTFDEHKCVIGCTTMAEAKALYLRNYSKGWTGFRDITPLTLAQFKSWLKKGDVTKPLAGQQFADFHKQATNPVAKLLKLYGRQYRRFGWRIALPAKRDMVDVAGAALLGGAGIAALNKWGPTPQPDESQLAETSQAVPAAQPDPVVQQQVQAPAHPAVSDYLPSMRDAGFGAGGAALGYGLGSLMLPENDEEDAPALQRYAPHIGAALGAGGGMLLSRYLQGGIKQAFDWAQLGQTIRQQLPGFHGWDTAAGAALGGGAGYLGSAFSSDAQTRRNRWRNTLLGAVGGGAVANLVGDRARRYISNIPGAFGYETSSMLNPARRAGLKGIWEGAVLDKPIAPVKGEQGWDPEHPGEWLPQGLPRRELLRRALGVHAPTKDDFFVNVGSAVHDGKMHDKIELNRQFFDPADSGKLNPKGLELFRDVVDPKDWAHMHAVIATKGKNFKADSSELYDGVSIGSNIFGNLPLATHGQAARARDVWDFGWSDYDASKFRDILRATLKDPKSLWTNTATAQDADKLLRTAGDKVVHNADVMKSLLARRVLNDVLLKRAPIFEQNFAGSYNPDETGSIPDLELFRSQALPLPNDALIGKGVGLGAGALAAGGMADWLLHRNDRKPKKRPVPPRHPAYA